MPPRKRPAPPPAPDPEYVEDAIPSGARQRPTDVSAIPGSAMDKIRVCIAAAEMRADHKSFRQIAVALNLRDSKEAARAVERGLSATPAQDVRGLRRLAELRFDRVASEALKVIEDPGPAFSQGKVMVNEATGEAYPDNGVRVAAIQAFRQIQADWRKFDGLDMPKRSLNMFTEIQLPDLHAHLERLRTELGLEAGEAPRAIEGTVLPPGDGSG